MKIKFYAHACFRLEGKSPQGNALSVVTDPYTPGSDASGFDPIDEAADIVLMSSDTDRFHSDPSHVTGIPTVVNTLDLPEGGQTIQGLHVNSYPVSESLTFDYGDRDPDDNAMYTFTLDGIRVLHIGDIGNPLSDEHLNALRGSVDVMFALTGGHATIALDDLDTAIDVIQPRAIIPMHYYSDRGVLQIQPVSDFTDRYPAEQVTYVGNTELVLDLDSLPNTRHIYVLEQSR
ncbi:MBL fold metallo-hydrolase [Chloroflexi bacterium TSY]|nr:MBL fold metallo-hydrolase [Chloroflexi bacterium TSY]